MTLRQKVGQVFIWTYSGTQLSPIMQSWLERYQPGALIVFSHNIQSPKQIAAFNSQLQRLASFKMKAPLFLMIDQEGGVVTRLKTSVALPSALAVGKMGDVEFIQKFGKANASVLHDVGFNLDLAPVLDISDPNKDSFIGNRAFGNDPENVAKITSAYSAGVAEGGMIPTAKHFPGHGGVVQDSHHTIPRKLATYDELEDRDLVPFQEFADSEFPRAMIVAHLALPNVDPSGVPATFSKVLIQDHLRGDMQFDGLVITDDLEMGGASVEGDIGERAIKAFLAGDDMLMVAGPPQHQRRAFDAILNAVTAGKITEARLNESVGRILNYKSELKIGPFTYDDKKTHEDIAALETMSRQVLRKNFRLSMAGKTASWPDVTPNTEALVFSADRFFYESFKEGFAGQASFYQLTPDTLERAERLIASPKFHFVVFYASGAQTAHWLAHLPEGLRRKVIVVNVNNSGELEEQKSFMSVLNINSRNPEAGFSLGEAMSSPDFRQPAGATSAGTPSPH